MIAINVKYIIGLYKWANSSLKAKDTDRNIIIKSKMINRIIHLFTFFISFLFCKEIFSFAMISFEVVKIQMD